MAARANWKGYLKLSLVSCAVALFPATTRSERVRFKIVNRETGHRVRYQVVDAETDEDVAQEDRLKGYKVDKEFYILVKDDEPDKVAPPSAPAPQPSNVINLMDALRHSVKSQRGAAAHRGKRIRGQASSKQAAPERKKLKRAS